MFSEIKTTDHLQIKKKPIFYPPDKHFLFSRLMKQRSLNSQSENEPSLYLSKVRKSTNIQRSFLSNATEIKNKNKKFKKKNNYSRTRRTTKDKKPKLHLSLLNMNKIALLKKNQQKTHLRSNTSDNIIELYLTLGDLMKKRKRRLVSTLKISNDQNAIFKNQKRQLDKRQIKLAGPRRDGQARRPSRKLREKTDHYKEHFLTDIVIDRSKDFKTKCNVNKIKKLKQLRQKNLARKKIDIKQINITAEFKENSRKKLHKSAQFRPKKKISQRFKSKFYDSIKSKIKSKLQMRLQWRRFSQSKHANEGFLYGNTQAMNLKKLKAISESKIKFDNFLLCTSSLQDKGVKTKNRLSWLSEQRAKKVFWHERDLDHILKTDPRIDSKVFRLSHHRQKNF